MNSTNEMLNLVSASTKQHDALKNKAHQAGFLGGVQIAGFGIPNQFLGLDLRTGPQRAAQAAPSFYLDQMNELIKKMDEMLDMALAPTRSGT